MNSSASAIVSPASPEEGASHWRQKVLPLVGLAAIVLLAAALRFASIDSLGYVNHYYAAAVKSMLQSWHNFFFVVAEPGGSVTVDKPPVGLWLQAISAYFLGVNSLGLLLPQILAGLASVVVVYHLVRRSFGPAAGLLAALTLAVMPVAVAVDRNNTIDSPMILTLLLAAWAFIKATESGRLRFLLAGAVLVGVAFNIKMLAAYLPVPAFLALYFLGANETFWRKAGKLALTGVVMLAVSLSWAVAVDLTPAEERPYVGSSSDNSELTLIVGYNGLNRLVGMGRNRDTKEGVNVASSSTTARGSGMAAAASEAPRGGTAGQPPNRPQNGGRPGGNPPTGGGGGGTPSNIGQAGPLRLLTAPLSKETSWLLPVAWVGLALLLAGARSSAPARQALLVWGGWLLTGGVFFSVASYFHEYYLALLGAPLAALTGIGLTELWKMRTRRPLFAVLLFSTLAAATLAFQFYTALSFVSTATWLIPTLALFVVGTGLLLFSAQPLTRRRWMLAGVILLVASLFITPVIWSGYTALYPGSNLSLPAAYSGKQSSPAASRYAQVNQSLLDYLQVNTQGTRYLMAVPTSMQGADYVLASGRPVLYMGGFKGSDTVIDADGLAQLVTGGELRYVYLSGGNSVSSGISSWVTTRCSRVAGFDSTTRNAGAPDGTTSGSTVNAGRTGNAQAISLYDCGNS